MTRGWSWSGSYVLSEVTERIGDVDVPRARDQRHAVAFDGAWAPNDRWRLSAAWQFHTGWPTTEVDLQVERLANGKPYVHWLYEPYNSSRLPAYHRLDTRITHVIPTRRGGVSIFLDLFNAYDRENPRAVVVYASVDSSGNVRKRQYIERLLPRLPSLGVVWEF
jgi:hypothetical protein